MKRIATLLASLCLLQSPYAANVVPEAISYQGRALTATGALMGAGTPVNRTVIFRIWDHPSNSLTANLVYSEQQTVTIAEGEFSVLLGTGSATAGSPLGYPETAKRLTNISSAFGGISRYLGVTIDDGTTAVDNEISPRQQLVSGGFAMRAKVAESVDGLAITTAMLANNAVTTTQLGDAAITTSKLAASAVTATQIADATITTAKIVDGIITSAKILDGTIATVDIADGTIATADLADGSITTAKIADGTIATADIAASSITTGTIADLTIATADIADSSITTGKIADGTIATADIAASSITTAKIADGTVATADIADGSITSAKIATDTILAGNIAAGAVGTSELATGVNISAGTLSTTGNANVAGKLGVGTTDTSQGAITTTIDGFVSTGTAVNGRTSYVRMSYQKARGGIAFDVYNSGQYQDIWRGFSYDGDSNIDFYSDRKLKKDIVDAEPMLDRLMQVPFRRFRWKDDSDPESKPEFGVIAQEVESLFPDLVATGSDGMKTVGYSSFATITAKALQEYKASNDVVLSKLSAQIHEKNAEIQALRDQSTAEMKALRDETAVLRRELATKDESLEARLIALEARFSKDGAPVTVSLKTARAAK